MRESHPQAPPLAQSPPRIRRGAARRAWMVAGTADLIQLAVFPMFAGGLLSPANNVLDIIVGLVMLRLLGWHWAFLPTFIAEVIPGLDLFPTWTAAVWFVSRSTIGRDRP